MATTLTCNTVCNGVSNNVRNAFRTTSRPDQTRPEVFYRTLLVCIGHLSLQRHLSDAPAKQRAGAENR